MNSENKKASLNQVYDYYPEKEGPDLWRVAYDDATGILTITGSGDMDVYTSESDVPWHGRRNQFKQAVIPEGITSLCPYCFSNCVELISVEISAWIPSIPKYCFVGCGKLTQLSLPGSIETIDDNAFSGCTSIGNFIIPGGVTTVGVRAFADCTAMESVALSASTTEIKHAAFYGCSALTNVFYCGVGFTCEMGQQNSYEVFPSSVTVIHILDTYDNDEICGVKVAKDLSQDCEQYDVNEWWNEFPKEDEEKVITASEPLEREYFDGTPWGFVASVILIMVVLAAVTGKNLYSNVQRQMNDVNSDDLLAMDEADDGAPA